MFFFWSRIWPMIKLCYIYLLSLLFSFNQKGVWLKSFCPLWLWTLKSLDLLFCKFFHLGLDWCFLVILFRLHTLSRKTTEVILCLPQCTILGGMWCWCLITDVVNFDLLVKVVSGRYLHYPFSSVTQLYPTLCDPMDCSTPDFPVHHQLLELAQTHVH